MVKPFSAYDLKSPLERAALFEGDLEDMIPRKPFPSGRALDSNLVSAQRHRTAVLRVSVRAVASTFSMKPSRSTLVALVSVLLCSTAAGARSLRSLLTGPDSSAFVTRELTQALLCAALALGSLGVFAAMSGRPSEIKVLRRLVFAVTLAKAALIPALYVSMPVASISTDAALYYLPQTLHALSGMIPYREFATSYSPFFHVLLMPGVLIWPHPGSIVATLFSIEVALIALYARRFGRARPTETWRVLFLYCWSPISFYWVAVFGYNSVLIALFAMIALLLADSRRDGLAGLAAVLGWAFSSLTMVLAWPAIVFFPRGSIIRRMVPLFVLAALVPVLLYARIDILYKALHGEYVATSGNLWFLASVILSESVDSPPIKLASMLSLLVGESILVGLYLRSVRLREDGAGAFDRASAFYCACSLVFMLLAYKTYPWYLTMCLIFLVHTLVCSGSSVAALISFALLGSLTTLERAVSVGLGLLLGLDGRWPLVCLDLVVVACIVYHAGRCMRIAIGPSSFWT
jgi:hypothetical protein